MISSPFRTEDEGNIIEALPLVSNEAGCVDKEIEVDNIKEHTNKLSVNVDNGDKKTETEKTVPLVNVSEIASVERKEERQEKRTSNSALFN